MEIIRKVVTPTVTVGAYTANDVVGARLQFVNIHTGILKSVTVSDLANQAVAYILVLFDSIPTDIADNVTFDIADADLPNILGVVSLPTTAQTNRQAFTDNSVSYAANLNIALKSDETDGDIWGFLITLGTPTYASASDVSVSIAVEQ